MQGLLGAAELRVVQINWQDNTGRQHEYYAGYDYRCCARVSVRVCVRFLQRVLLALASGVWNAAHLRCCHRIRCRLSRCMTSGPRYQQHSLSKCVLVDCNRPRSWRGNLQLAASEVSPKSCNLRRKGVGALAASK